jgi:hypothetical protein
MVRLARLAVLVALVIPFSGAYEMTWALPAARAGTLEMTSCSGFGDGAADTDVGGMVWAGLSKGGFSTANECGQGRALQIAPSGANGPHWADNGVWQTVTPPAIQITHAITPVNEVLIDPNRGDGYVAGFFWSGGAQTITPQNNCCGGMYYGSGINRSLGSSRYFGWQVTCLLSSCGAPFQALDVRGVDLVAVDSTPPSLLALGSNNIWYQGGQWIRGSGWPASFQASADDGICSMREIIDGSSIQGPYDATRNTHSWTQCPSPQTMGETIDTTQYSNGSLALTLSAADAASPANVSSPATTLHVDNTPVTLSLTGPSDASSTAGTQYVSAAASAGPSSVSAIYCSVDGGAYAAHSGASAQIPVAGIGSHQVSCYAQNTAIDPNGRPASSPSQTFAMLIRQPTASAISFSRIADALRCHNATIKVHVKGKPRTVKRHGKKVRVPGRPRVVKRRVRHCHARTVRRKVTVIVKRHGKPVKVTRVRRVALLPHVVQKAKRRVGHGKATTVSGYLGLANGTALAGHGVEIFSAPDNGLGDFTPMTSVITGINGTWTAKVPPGPSRLIEAVYGGDATTQPVTSAIVKLIVPARIATSISPRILPWPGAVTIRGHLEGGYVPPDGVALRLLVRYPGSRHGSPLLALRTNAEGAFAIRWSFYSGRGVATYPMWIATTATESDYPFAASAGPRISVTFGRRTPHQHHQRRHKASRHEHGAKHHHPRKRHRAKHRKR